MYICSFFFCERYADHRDLHVLTHSFPTRRSSDLKGLRARPAHKARKVKREPLERRALLVRKGLKAKPEPPAPRVLPVRKAKPVQPVRRGRRVRSEEHTSELQSLMRISYAVFCLKKTTRSSTEHTKSTNNTSAQQFPSEST